MLTDTDRVEIAPRPAAAKVSRPPHALAVVRAGAAWRARLASRPHVVVGRWLATAVAASLAVDAYVHVTDGYIYESNVGGIVTQAHLFYIEAAVAALVAVLLLLRPSASTWTLALVVAGTALSAVVLYRYVDVGAIGPVPDLYEPTWDVPGKLLSAYAEGLAALLSAAAVVATHRTARRTRRAAVHGADGRDSPPGNSPHMSG
jgi:hypothetical protein